MLQAHKLQITQSDEIEMQRALMFQAQKIQIHTPKYKFRHQTYKSRQQNTSPGTRKASPDTTLHVTGDSGITLEESGGTTRKLIITPVRLKYARNKIMKIYN